MDSNVVTVDLRELLVARVAEASRGEVSDKSITEVMQSRSDSASPQDG